MAPHSSTLAWTIPWMEEPGGVHGVTEGPTWLSDFTFTFHFHALEKEMATHSSVLAWRIPGMGEPGGLPSMVSHRVRHDWSDLAAAATVLRLNIWLRTFPYTTLSFLDFFVGDFIFLHPFFKKYHFLYYLFLAAPGLQCCVGAFCLCGKCGLISLRCLDFSLRWRLLLQKMGSRCMSFRGCSMWALESTASVVVVSCSGIFPHWGSNPYPLLWHMDSLPLDYQGSPPFSNKDLEWLIKKIHWEF